MQNKDRILVEDALKHMHDFSERELAVSEESLSGVLGQGVAEGGRVLSALEEGGLAEAQGPSWRLTDRGLEYAVQVIRAHRLYEAFLARETGEAETAWHSRAEVMEHQLTPDELDTLAERLGHPRYDPHGDPIPTRSGELPATPGVFLRSVEPGFEGRITHIEDEPEEVYSRLVKLNLAPGMRLRLLNFIDQEFQANVEGRVVSLDRQMAANLRVAPLAGGERFDESSQRLSDLVRGETARVTGLSPACRGAERRRLLDIGMVPGSAIIVEMTSPMRNPVAYRIRGTVIALRREQAEHVFIHKTIRT